MVIALLSDFGLYDNYVGVVKAVIYAHGYSGPIVDITHDISPFSIEQAQFMLAASYKFFPNESIFVVIVDPGVGTSRNIIFAYNETYYFFMPDNGILSCIPDIVEVRAIDTTQFNNASSTFHGRDIFAVVAATLAVQGVTSIPSYGISEYVHKPFPYYEIDDGIVRAKVLHIDRFGNCILSLPNEHYSVTLHHILIHNKTIVLVPCKTYGQLAHTAVGIMPGSSGFVELCKREQRCDANLHLQIGDMVTLIYG